VTNIRWRDSYRMPRIIIFDARLAGFWFLPMLHFRTWTVLLALLATFVLYYFEVRKRMSLNSAGRWLKFKMLGNYRRGHPATKRWAIDYGRSGRHL
jgi:intracellular multiplication protein IcmT